MSEAGIGAVVEATRAGGGLTIESIVAVDSPREFRIHPSERIVAYTAESGGTRQLFTLSLRGPAAPAVQLTASELAPTRMEPGLADRCPGPASGPAAA